MESTRWLDTSTLSKYLDHPAINSIPDRAKAKCPTSDLRRDDPFPVAEVVGQRCMLGLVDSCQGRYSLLDSKTLRAA